MQKILLSIGNNDDFQATFDGKPFEGMTLRLSEKSLQRKFLQHIGIPPKLYLRIQRFQNALAQMQQDKFDPILAQNAWTFLLKIKPITDV